MKIRNLFLTAVTAVFTFASCEELMNMGEPEISISSEEMSFDAAGGDQTLTIEASREWKVETDADWVVVSPESGEGSLEKQTVTVTVLENTGMDRTAEVTFSIVVAGLAMDSEILTVSQSGPGGSAEALIVYFNDYDKEEAQKTYGSGSSYPYLDQFDGWMNATGTGAESVEYSYSGMSARSNSTSNSSYSDYEGSGLNNMFFGKSAYLATKNISLGGATGLTLSFGTEKYDGNDKTATFDHSEFHVYLSNDGVKWVEIQYTFAGTAAGRWNVASTSFTVPSGTDKLSICVKADAASVYRMDDFRLVVSEGGETVDFTKGVEMDFTAGGSTGGSTGTPESKGKKTVAEFISAADTGNYYELTGTVSGFNSKYCSFDLTDASGKIYVYSVLDESKSEWTNKISNGGTITIYGKYLYYEQKSQHEVVDAYIVSFTAGEGGGGTVEPSIPESKGKKTVAEFISAADTQNYYELTGTVSGFNSQYCSFDLTDDSGKIYVYSVLDASKSEWKSKISNGGTVTLYGKYLYFEKNQKHEVVEAHIVSFTAGEGGGEVTPPSGSEGQYDPNVTWTLGSSAYDKTDSYNPQTATVNGVAVANLLKLGTSSKVGNATINVPAGTKKLGFYCIAWKGKTGTMVKFSTDAGEITTITPAANDGAAGNPVYTITLADTDYYTVDVPDGVTSIKVETTVASQGRAMFIGMKALSE